jgi:hypothetical protein
MTTFCSVIYQSSKSPHRGFVCSSTFIATLNNTSICGSKANTSSCNVNIVGTLKQSFLCHPHHESMWGCRGIDPHILNAGITMWVVRSISWSRYPRGNMPQCTRLPGTRGGLDVQKQRIISCYCLSGYYDKEGRQEKGSLNLLCATEQKI